jgi:hypothetical protein
MENNTNNTIENNTNNTIENNTNNTMENNTNNTQMENNNDNKLHRFQETDSNSTTFYTIVDGTEIFKDDSENFSWGNLMLRLEKAAAIKGYTIYSGQYVDRDPYLNMDTMKFVQVHGDKQLMSGQLLLLRSNSSLDGLL